VYRVERILIKTLSDLRENHCVLCG